jgi:hypothetical protein
MGQFDQTARYAAKLNPSGFFRWLLGPPPFPLTFREWADTRRLTLPGDPDRTNDVVAVFDNSEVPERPFTLILELQTEPDPTILERLGLYALTLRLELLGTAGARDIGVAVVNLTGSGESAGLTIPFPGVPGCGLSILPLQRNLCDCDAAATITEIAAATTDRCMLPWIPLMRGGGEVAIITEWKRLAEQEPSDRLRTIYGALGLVFADAAKRAVQWRKALENWNMRESQVIMEWIREGKEAGLLEATRDALLTMLEVRFQLQVPADIKLAIEGTNDRTTLSRWIKAALTVPTLDAFRAAMK